MKLGFMLWIPNFVSDYLQLANEFGSLYWIFHFTSSVTPRWWSHLVWFFGLNLSNILNSWYYWHEIGIYVLDSKSLLDYLQLPINSDPCIGFFTSSLTPSCQGRTPRAWQQNARNGRGGLMLWINWMPWVKVVVLVSQRSSCTLSAANDEAKPVVGDGRGGLQGRGSKTPETGAAA